MFFFESGDTEVFKATRNKLFASNEKKIESSLDSSQMSAGKRYVLKIDDHKKKYTSSKKSHRSGD